MTSAARKRLHDGLRDLYQRKASAMTRRPVFAEGSGHARARLGDGMICDVDHGTRRMQVDLPAEEGGTATAPHPGELMRASLGGCLAFGYRLWGARLDVSIASVEIDITCTYDTRGQMGVSDDVPVGWQTLNISVTIVSDAPEAEVRRVVQTADRMSPMLANISADVKRSHRLTVLTEGTKCSVQGHALIANRIENQSPHKG